MIIDSLVIGKAEMVVNVTKRHRLNKERGK